MIDPAKLEITIRAECEWLSAQADQYNNYGKTAKSSAERTFFLGRRDDYNVSLAMLEQILWDAAKD